MVSIGFGSGNTSIATEALCRRCIGLAFDPTLVTSAASRLRRKYDGTTAVVQLSFILEDVFPSLSELGTIDKETCPMCIFMSEVIWALVQSHPEMIRRANDSIFRHMNKICGPSLHVSLALASFHLEPSSVNYKNNDNCISGHIRGRINVGGLSQPVKIEVRDRDLGWLPERPALDVLSEEVKRLVLRWKSGCASTGSSHVKCRKLDARGQLVIPNRLLHVISQDTIRLEHTAGLTEEYAILSYCWGSSSTVTSAKTVMANLAQRLAGFPIASLPPTIRDSVILARHLGINYLWVDAICIVQDSGEWAEESKWMMEYYENACLTIAPIACSSADESFLTYRSHFVSRKILWPSERDDHLQFRFPYYRGIQEEFLSAPWFTRGWTFQERLLSSRMLFVGKAGIMLECRTEYLAIDHDGTHSGPALGDFMPLSDVETVDSVEWSNYDKVRHRWYQLVGHYAGRKLSREADRLIALSGVAYKFTEIFRTLKEDMLMPDVGTYLDGFWQLDIWHGLSWKIATESAPTARSGRFPSWSWCSANTTLTWDDGVGCLSDGELLEVVQEPDSTQMASTSVYGLVVKTWGFTIELLQTALPPDLSIDISFDNGMPLNMNADANGGLMAIVLTARLHLSDDPVTKPHDISGLIISASGTKHKHFGTFYRVGAFFIAVDKTSEGHVNVSDEEEDDFVFEFDEFPVRGHDFASSTGGWLFRQIYATRGIFALF